MKGLGDAVADMDAERVVGRRGGLSGARVVHEAAEPPGGEELVTAAGRFPNLARAKMAAVGIRVADVLHDAEFAVPGQAGASRCRTDGAQRVAEGKDLFLGDTERGTQTVIIGVLKRDQGVETVVAASELDENENVPVFLRGGGAGERGGDEEIAARSGEGEQADAVAGKPKKLPPGRRETRKRSSRPWEWSVGARKTNQQS